MGFVGVYETWMAIRKETKDIQEFPFREEDRVCLKIEHQTLG